MTPELAAILTNLSDLIQVAKDAPNAKERRVALSTLWFVLNDAQDANNALLMDTRTIEHLLETHADAHV